MREAPKEISGNIVFIWVGFALAIMITVVMMGRSNPALRERQLLVFPAVVDQLKYGYGIAHPSGLSVDQVNAKIAKRYPLLGRDLLKTEGIFGYWREKRIYNNVLGKIHFNLRDHLYMLGIYTFDEKLLPTTSKKSVAGKDFHTFIIDPQGKVRPYADKLFHSRYSISMIIEQVDQQHYIFFLSKQPIEKVIETYNNVSQNVSH